MIHIGTDENFDELMRGEVYAVVDFYGEHCGSCTALAPIFNDAGNDFGMIKFIKVNCTFNRGLTKRFGILGFPTVKYFKDGREVRETRGWMERKKLNENIAALLYEYPAPELKNE